MINHFVILFKQFFHKILLLTLLASGITVHGQIEIISGNSDNEFSSVTDLRIFDTVRYSVVVTNPEKFSPEDYVMLYVVKGLELDLSDGEFTGYRSCIGNYALLFIKDIIGDTVIFNASSGFLDPSNGTPEQKNGWVSQLIKVPVYDNVVVDGELTTQPWDSLSGTGGVLALFVKNKLTLNADINMSGKGFAGADPTGDIYGSGCYVPGSIAYNQRNYGVAYMDSAGRKGEGAVRRNYNMTRGKGKMINGGGGGNGKYAGGGGGANYNIGGSGGGQTNQCGGIINAEVAGEGGFGFVGSLYSNSGDYKNRIWLGGGGGTGTQDPLFPASPGGNGGGIVFIVADTIETNGAYGIYANGESVATAVSGPGGGGGGGGAIVLEVNGYISPLVLSAIGGDGGSTNNATHYTGPGGGGGGGVYWVKNNDSLLQPVDTTKSKGGTSVLGAGGSNGIDGAEAFLLEGLSAPLNGLVFNSVPGDLTVCSDTIPPTIDAATPKGGDGSVPVIRWKQSKDKIVWVDADGVNDQEDYQFTAPLDSTMHYSREVTIGTVTDSLAILTYTVLPAIEGNLIATDDIIQCEGVLPSTALFPASTLSGANVENDTTFQWQKWTVHGQTPVSAEGINNLRSYSLPMLSDTTYFRRVVKSGVCRSVSDTIAINVLDAITNNTISSRDTLCSGQAPQLLIGGDAGGGDNSSYWYRWEESETLADGFNYSGITTRDLDYTATPFTADRYFRRIVYSGSDSSCLYTSDTFKIEVLDKIDNNLIHADPVISVCQFDQLANGGLLGLDPVGGDNFYRYTWQVTDDLVTWGDSLITTLPVPFNLSSFSGADTLYIRRFVVSGAEDVCQDYSDTITIDIVRAITNNVLTPRTETYCYGDRLTSEITAQTAVSDDNELGIEWQYRFDSGEWGPAPFPDGGYSWDYTYDEELTDTLFFRRLVWSRKSDSICSSFTEDSVKIYVQPAISNNLINTGNLTYICAGEELSLAGTTRSELSGGDGTYALQWQDREGAELFADIAGGTNEVLVEQDISLTKEFRRVVTSGECEDTSAAVVIPVRELPEGFLSLSSLIDTVICEKEVSLIININNTESYLWHRAIIEHTPFGATDTIGGTGSSDEIIIPHSPETDDSMTYFYRLAYLVDNMGCVARIKEGVPAVKVYQKPEPKIVSTTTEVCSETLEIEGSDLNGAVDAFWFEQRGDNYVTFEDSHSPKTVLQLNTDVTGYPYNIEQLTIGWKIVTPRCDSTAFTTITFYQSPDSTTLKADTVKFYVQETYDLSLVEPMLDAGYGTWTADNSGASVIDKKIATNFTYDQEHLFTWTVSNGVCEPQSDQVVIVQYDLMQYNAFSPDNDLFNQEFVIPGLIHTDDFTFSLFNSWGTKVAEITKADARIQEVEIDGRFREEHIIWDGTLGSSGDAAPSGTYYYTLTYTLGGVEFDPKPGYIILRR